MHGSGKVGGGSDPFSMPTADPLGGATGTRSDEPAKCTAPVDVDQLATPILGMKVGDRTSAEASLRRDSSGATTSTCSTFKTTREAASRMVTPWDALPPSLKAFLTTVGRTDTNSTRFAKLAKAMDQCTASEHWPDNKDLLPFVG